MTAAVQPIDEALETLRRIWEEVLDVPVTSPEENFFELGGDSMLALIVASRAGKAGLAMPPSGVLRQPTLRGLAEAVLDPALFENW
ncbi:phosphopantetheine-binding protein [Streptacidiphilus jiangxiensis]|uniref:Phosphopantetheine attachment site n=1 Tax=Streptacidiphilus jiangxiensis TaxID=235985 RepID=A0A1H7VMG2_STRJI|nr:phosphopantetheine-binding protein [Streptacidiphilus jiangxiensis]SEM10492.1 Phosphopantetheine attachment site [Streptacidiphilus jiangxiensis]